MTYQAAPKGGLLGLGRSLGQANRSLQIPTLSTERNNDSWSQGYGRSNVPKVPNVYNVPKVPNVPIVSNAEMSQTLGNYTDIELVKRKSLDALARLGTNFQYNLMVRKREEALNLAGVKDAEARRVFRWMAPKAKRNCLKDILGNTKTGNHSKGLT